MNPSLTSPLIKSRPSIEAWSVRIVALLAALMGVVNLFSAIIPAMHDRLLIIEDVFPMEVLHGTRLAAALAGFALLLLASSLWRRKRTAWLLTILILSGSIVMNLIKGLDYEEASLNALLIILLLLLRPNYHADSDRPSVRQGLIVLVWAFGFTLAYGTLGLDLLDQKIQDLLGPADYQTFKQYEQSLGERMQVQMFKAALPGELALTDQQESELIAVMTEERTALPATALLNTKTPDPAQLTEQNIAEALKQLEQLQSRYADRAAGILTPAQLEQFTKWQQQWDALCRRWD